MPGVTEFAAKVPQRYQGSTIAGFDPAQMSGQQQVLNAAGTQNTLAGGGAGTTLDWLSPNALDITKQPGLQGNIDAATRPITQALTEQALPAIRSRRSRRATSERRARGSLRAWPVDGRRRRLATPRVNLVGKAYQTNVDAQLKALGLLPQTQATQTAGGLTTSGVGDVRQGMTKRCSVRMWRISTTTKWHHTFNRRTS